MGANPTVVACGDRSQLWRGEEAGGKPMALVPDGEHTIEPFVDFDEHLRVAAAARARQNLETPGAHRDGVIVGDAPLVFEAKDGVRIETGGPGPVGRRGVRSGLGEAGIIAREELGEKRIGAVQVTDACEAEFGDQAVLEGAEAIFDATLRLGGGGGDPADAELLQHAPDLRGPRHAGQLLGERWGRALVAVEDAMPVAIDGEGKPAREGDVPEEAEVAIGILRVPKLAYEHAPGGIVHDGEESHPWATPFQPVVHAAVDLEEHARAGHALAPTPVATGPASLRALESGVVQHAPQRSVGDMDPFPLGQQLLEMEMIGTRVRGLRQGDDPVAQRIVQAARRAATAIAVDQGGGPARPVLGPQATDVTRRPPEQGSGVGGRQLCPFERVEDEELLLCPLCQGNHALPIRRWERTFSLAN